MLNAKKRINIDSSIAEEVEPILNQMGLSIASATNILLKNIVETREFPIKMTTKKISVEKLVNELSNYKIPVDTIKLFAGELSGWESRFDHLMNQQLAFFLKMLSDLLKRKAFVFNFDALNKEFSKEYWYGDLYYHKDYYAEVIKKLKKDSSFTMITLSLILDRMIELLQDDGDYEFKFEMRFIQIPFRDFLISEDKVIIETYLRKESNKIINALKRLQKLANERNFVLFL